MKTTLFIPTAHTEKAKPSPWFGMRLEAAIDYAREHAKEDCVFLISGRGPDASMNIPITEAEIGKKYILEKWPQAKIIKEDLSVETGGNFAFSKPLILDLKPDEMIIFTSQVLKARVEYFVQKLFNFKFPCRLNLLEDDLSRDIRAVEKEPHALVMFRKLLDHVEDGDDAAAREILLYQTPFYFKGLISDQEFFAKYWPGGLADYNRKAGSKSGAK